jgi:hypothetical protein
VFASSLVLSPSGKVRNVVPNHPLRRLTGFRRSPEFYFCLDFLADPSAIGSKPVP